MQLSQLVNEAYTLAARMLSEPADAFDVIQDAATSALEDKKAKRLNEQANAEAASGKTIAGQPFKSWFFKVVRNKAIDKLRKNKRETLRYVDDSAVKSDAFVSNDASSNINSKQSSNDPSEILAQTQLKLCIDAALQNISITHREIILLKDYHDFSYAEIAEILEIPTGSVMSRLHRARGALKKQLSQLTEQGDYCE